MASEGSSVAPTSEKPLPKRSRLSSWFGKKSSGTSATDAENSSYRPKSTLGILSDKETDEVPGTVLLLSSNRNEPLGLRHQPRRGSVSSLPSPYSPSRTSSRSVPPQKKTANGQIILNPQPDDSANDPLNWPVWRRDAALVSLGFYCLMGGGMTPVLAAGFSQVASDYGVSTQKVAYTTGLYMLGLGVGSVIMSPTAILFGKRPVYLLGATLFILSAVWCALSPNYPSLVVARVFMGIAVSPVECLPSATIAEIFFLHERAYRVGIYTLLLLGGKNLIPLVSAAIISAKGWRWVFWVVAIVVGGCLALLFFFVPETFWDRTPRPHQPRKGPNIYRGVSNIMTHGFRGRHPHAHRLEDPPSDEDAAAVQSNKTRKGHVGFVDGAREDDTHDLEKVHNEEQENQIAPAHQPRQGTLSPSELETGRPFELSPTRSEASVAVPPATPAAQYTNRLREQPRISFAYYLRPWNGRIAHNNWFRVALRPFILFAYPAVLWSATVYALSVGWLIVISESVSSIYEKRDSYNFTSLQVGLVYISPFVGGLLGTAVAGKVSDIIVKYMTRRNGGIYEPEFRLVMAIPIAIATTIGLMGFGWSSQERDVWIVPTIFFGIVSFGCCLGSTTSITFCVDSYRQYAGEALVTLNWSKNVFHGLIFSLFIVDWLDAEGSRLVFIALGVIQMGCLATTIPMYIYGKRLRMWTVRKQLMEKF
ncbi:putative MFS transporter [Aspergillus saccharolyticus JOP 1030-1]|uniref:MFS transporter n=1 Tax=Aspergillus saccharolyticus JOP 1030-1 TaxID=1450539 RepID=A0A318ZJX0_9EURO|nr:MFS transporter [Aspergillus saccharolyticus JOP 1030-1]PYH47806.1 MFS transporter [Aspergillus saccharolyticus JOP 1030-1]